MRFVARKPPTGSGADKIVASVTGPEGTCDCGGSGGVEEDAETENNCPCCPTVEVSEGSTARANERGFEGFASFKLVLVDTAGCTGKDDC
jgi:hypothetical protein